MRSYLILIIAVLTSTLLSAHPGIGLVYDGHQFIYYSDLSHIWQLDTETGALEIAVKDVHSHELLLDKKGNLYGEHYWYDAAAQSFKNYIWKLDSQGEFRKIRETISGENTDFGFVRDSLFRSYSFENNNGKFTIIRSDSLNFEKLNSRDLKRPGWKYIGKDGSFYFSDNQSLFVLQNNELTELSSNLASSRFPFSLLADEHSLYGIWQDEDQNIYLANYGGRLVKRIDQKGEVAKVLKSAFFWSPINGVFDKNQQLWLMESNVLGSVRVHKIPGEIKSISNPFLIENLFLSVFCLFLISGLYNLIMYWIK